MARQVTPMRGPLAAAASGPAPLPHGVHLRGLEPADTEALGALMTAAYAGTIDDHGEPAHWHQDEARRAVAGAFGTVVWPGSVVAVAHDDVLVSAAVVTRLERRLLLAFALTAPAWRGRGVGTAVLADAAARLLAAGDTEWTLAVTVGNPARRLYERLGFGADESLRSNPAS